MSESNHTASLEAFSLQTARLNRGMSIRQLALAVGMAQQTLANLENGKPVHPASAKVVADYFGVQVTDLMSPSVSHQDAA